MDMPHHLTVTLDDRLFAFAEVQVDSGVYGSVADVLVAALANFEVKVAEPRAALVEGEESGEFQPVDFDAFLAEKHQSKRA